MGCGFMSSYFGYNNPNAWWWMLGIGLVKVLVFVGIIILVYKLVKKTKSSNITSNNAASIVRERFALGEINEEEYRARMKLLKK
ncbi:SHOCT domain-containing protein [Sporosalibacterium faouarense]|uniref:SHOCT domain-containing protein n=1 Tax=Sporosalibacterium faouarense TaxID=516123 RepID=UPI00141D3840|nr:hypothetical protein [Sporosalibacterium faouarense]MTI48528.1 hypothetical protein [Bacillota bacterium]